MTTVHISKLCTNSTDQRFVEKYECLVTMATGYNELSCDVPIMEDFCHVACVFYRVPLLARVSAG